MDDVIKSLLPKTPTHARIFARIAVVLMLCAQTAAAEPITEARVAAHAAQLAEIKAEEAGTRAAEAALTEARVWPNPAVAWSRESLSDSTQDILSVQVPVPLGTQRSTRAALARVDVAEARGHAAERRGQLTVDALLLFYDAVAERERARILSEAVTVLDEARRVTALRQKQGSASGYDEARLSIEAELARSRLREAQAAMEGARQRLEERLGLEGELEGDLETTPREDTPGAGVALGLARRGLMSARTQAAQAAAATKGRLWLPDLSLAFGLNRVDSQSGGETGFGYVAGIVLELPLFDREQGAIARAAASRMATRARLEASRRLVRSEVMAEHHRLVTATRELERFRGSVAEPVELLVRSTAAGYREGERSILELLDAHRARVDVLLRILDLRIRAKQAEVRLRAAKGEWT